MLDLLSRLAAKSLVVVESTPGNGIRYRFLEIVKQYASETLLRTAEVNDVHARHRDWFLSRAERFNVAAHSPMEAAELARLDAELDNLRAALEWSATHTKGLDHALTVAGRLWWFWQAHGYYKEGRAYLERLLDRAEPGTAPGCRAQALIGAGMLAWNQGGSADLAAARELLTRAVAIAREHRSRRVLAEAVGGLARTIRDQGDHVLGGYLLEEAFRLAEMDGDRWRAARSLNGLGVLASEQGDFVRARDYFERSLARCREVGDAFGVATELSNMGNVAYRQGNLKNALALVSQAMAMRREQHVRWGLPRDLVICAGVAARYRWAEKAARLYGAADAVNEEMGKVSAFRDPQGIERQYRRDVASARRQLGPLAFAVATTAGRSLSVDQMVSEALEVQEAALAKPVRLAT
jgi:non-specific serine/threonine protein kinase